MNPERDCVKCIICNLGVVHIVTDIQELLRVRAVPEEGKENFIRLLVEAERAAEAARECLLQLLD